MAESENNVELKRKADENQGGDGNEEDDGWVGPMPSEATKAKKRKGRFLVVNYLANSHSFPLTFGCFCFVFLKTQSIA
uniref:Uncharacterized protein n=1 Tax=Seriola lalandi dorsalis TaxID=1841481 RepID=A0A3B4WX23_SERLL